MSLQQKWVTGYLPNGIRLTVRLHDNPLKGGFEANYLARRTRSRAGIYLIVHLPSKQVYIGESENLLARLHRHRYLLRHGLFSNYPSLQADWDKNPSDFQWRILHVGPAFLLRKFRTQVEAAYRKHPGLKLYPRLVSPRRRYEPLMIIGPDNETVPLRPKTVKLIGIYAIECGANGKRYLGYVIDLVDRLQKHSRNLKKGEHSNKELQADYNLYADQFTFRILFHGGVLNQKVFLKSFEKLLILYYESHWTPGIYNRTGTQKHTRVGSVLKATTLNRIRIARRGQPRFKPARPGVGIKVILGPYVWIFPSIREGARRIKHIEGAPRRSTLDKYLNDPYILNVVRATADELKTPTSSESLKAIKQISYEILRTRKLKSPGLPAQSLWAVDGVYPSLAEACRVLTLAKQRYAEKHGAVAAQEKFGSVNRKSLKRRLDNPNDKTVVATD